MMLQETYDFDGAEKYLKIARSAHEAGDANTFVAAIKLVTVALCIPDPPSTEVQVTRLKRR